MLRSAPFLMLWFYKDEPNKSFSKQHRPYWLIQLINRLFDNMEYFLMPKQYQNSNANGNMPEYTFAALRLTEAQKEHFEGWFSNNASEFETIIASFSVTGIKISFSWDDNNDCFIASFTDNNKKSPNFQKVLTSRAEDWFKALMMNAYKCIVVLDGEPWPTEKKGNSWG